MAPNRAYRKVAGVRQWFDLRGIRAEKDYSTVGLPDYELALRVVQMGLRAGKTPSAVIDEATARFPKMRPALLRVMDKDLGRCQVTIRLDDLLPYLEAYEEMRSRRR